MTNEKEAGMVSLGLIFEDLLKVEKILNKYSGSDDPQDLKQGLKILEKSKERLSPLAKEKRVPELDLAREDLISIIEALKRDPNIPQVLKELESVKLNLLEYNMRGRKIHNS